MNKKYGQPIDIYDVLNYIAWGTLILFTIIVVALLATLQPTKINHIIIIGVAIVGIMSFFILLIISKVICNRLIELELRIKELEKKENEEDEK